MKKIFCIILLMFFSCTCIFAEEMKVLSAGISVNQVPKALYGNWRVVSKLESSDSYGTFKPQSSDMWTISRVNDVITLSNPFTGASATVTIKNIEGNLIIFSKKAPYDNKVLTDTVSIRVEKDGFSGINTLVLETLSNIDGSLIKTENARYIIKGEKISGDNIIE